MSNYYQYLLKYFTIFYDIICAIIDMLLLPIDELLILLFAMLILQPNDTLPLPAVILLLIFIINPNFPNNN